MSYLVKVLNNFSPKLVKYLHEVNFALFGAVRHGHELIIQHNTILDEFSNSDKKLFFIEIGSERGVGSTYKLSRMMNKKGFHFITVDCDETSYQSAKDVTNNVPNSEAHLKKGEEFLGEWSENNLVGVYLDAYDIQTSWHSDNYSDFTEGKGTEIINDSNKASWEMHLLASQNCYDKVILGGIICFDDSWNNGKEWCGKGRTAIPFLLENGYEVIEEANPFCVILKRIK